MQSEAFRVIDAWGYAQPTSEIVWVKTTKNGNVATGMGRTVRNAHEIALICKRKDAPTWPKLDVVKDHGVRSVLEADEDWGLEVRAERGQHSRKPDAFYELIDRLFHGPVIELFARRQWKNWYCYGDQMPRGNGA
jgi:N6-adenosine-specific RNA methylase IME4